MSYAIRVEGVGKSYVIAHQQRQHYHTLRDVLAGRAKSVARGLTKLTRHPHRRDPSREEFWALRDVGFEVRPGERVGVIGRNGAGKSTLLKILSRITEPSTGRITIRGRVASLLEVGTGFHPELTGRENIFLNGAILGMGRAEIKRKFDEIVAFAEVERFLDTPVKRYSSGMHVRLAFAVAAHLEPEILIVDEVLAVGDAAFQKKCLGKMGDVSRDGRTVLFVSHNMSAVRQLCDRGIVLNGGLKVFDGEVGDAVECYQRAVLAQHEDSCPNPVVLGKPVGDPPIWLRSVGVFDKSLNPSVLVEHREGCIVTLGIRVERSSRNYYSALLVHDSYGNNIIFTTDEDLSDPPVAGVPPGLYHYDIAIPGRLLKPGSYFLTPVVCLTHQGKVDRRDGVVRIEVQDSLTRRGTKQLYRPAALVAPEIEWVLRQEGASSFPSHGNGIRSAGEQAASL